jgi:hypothetical protein
MGEGRGEAFIDGSFVPAQKGGRCRLDKAG